MLTVDVAAWGADLFGRHHGAAVRRELLRKIAGSPAVVLDFRNVRNMSLSFADECFGEFMAELAAKPTRPHVRFTGTTEDTRAALRFVMRKRRVTIPA
jgi:hypothetical protein